MSIHCQVETNIQDHDNGVYHSQSNTSGYTGHRNWICVEEIVCEEKCILYSGKLVPGFYHGDTTVLAGTVFQELGSIQ